MLVKGATAIIWTDAKSVSIDLQKTVIRTDISFREKCSLKCRLQNIDHFVQGSCVKYPVRIQ